MQQARPDVPEGHSILHRWFVQYNPFYLISAMLCIAGLRMISLGLAERGSAFGDIGVGAINEVYAFALIGGAALLTRLGQRRPAVMLALLAVVYQGDLMFHVEASSYLHGIGIVAAAAWAVIFVAKLRALAWALELRPSRAAIALAAYGGIGLAAVPQIVNRMNVESRGAVVGLWVFSLGALALHVSPTVASAVELDDWGRTVFRRAMPIVWLIWGSLLGVHVYFWSTTFPLDLHALIPAAMLLGTRAFRKESSVWAAVTATLVLVALMAPPLFSLTGIMAAATLALRAYRHYREVIESPASASAAPFRAGPGDAVAQMPRRTWIVVPASPGVQRRLLVGAMFSAYLAMWTSHWSGGPWPRHVLWLDVVLTAVVLFLALRSKIRVALVPLVATCAHFLVQMHVVTGPGSTLQWGLLFTGVAYVLLLGSLAANYWLRDAQPARAADATGDSASQQVS